LITGITRPFTLTTLRTTSGAFGSDVTSTTRTIRSTADSGNALVTYYSTENFPPLNNAARCWQDSQACASYQLFGLSVSPTGHAREAEPRI
jgi:hypothetical protein